MLYISKCAIQINKMDLKPTYLIHVNKLKPFSALILS